MLEKIWDAASLIQNELEKWIEISILNVHRKLTHEINWDSTNLRKSLRFIVSTSSSRIQIIRVDCCSHFSIGQTVTRSVPRRNWYQILYTYGMRTFVSLLVLDGVSISCAHEKETIKLYIITINLPLPTRNHCDSAWFIFVFVYSVLGL